MFLRQALVDTVVFRCVDCACTWSVEYDVHRVEDGHGHERDYFFRNHQPIADPRAPGAVLCSQCGSFQVSASVTTSRPVHEESPVWDGDADHAGTGD